LLPVEKLYSTNNAKSARDDKIAYEIIVFQGILEHATLCDKKLKVKKASLELSSMKKHYHC